MKAVAQKSVRRRCAWPSSDISIRYHDREWGVPLKNDRKLFEFLVLDAMQAGLSWEIILRKREGFRAAFDEFDPEKIARYDKRRIQRLLADPGIVRNRLKIDAFISNARAYLNLRDRPGAFDHYIWQFTDGKVVRRRPLKLSAIAVSTAQSEAMSKDLKQRGFRFVGPTICYAFMQAVGIVDEHQRNCWIAARGRNA